MKLPVQEVSALHSQLAHSRTRTRAFEVNCSISYVRSLVPRLSFSVESRFRNVISHTQFTFVCHGNFRMTTSTPSAPWINAHAHSFAMIRLVHIMPPYKLATSCKHYAGILRGWRMRSYNPQTLTIYLCLAEALELTVAILLNQLRAPRLSDLIRKRKVHCNLLRGCRQSFLETRISYPSQGISWTTILALQDTRGLLNDTNGLGATRD